MSQLDSDESFTYIVHPVSSSIQCAERMEVHNLPSLSDAIEGGEGRSGSLLIHRSTFVTDALSGFSRLESDRVSMPGGGIVPDVVEPRSRMPCSAVPEEFSGEIWPYVWLQFVRDISRESLLIDGVLHTNPYDALESMRVFLGRVYDETATGVAGVSKEDTENDRSNTVAPNARGEGLVSRVAGAFWTVCSRARGVYAEVRRRNSLAQAIQLVILTAQQTVLALPVEMLQAQFCKGFEHTIFVGEPQMGKETEDVDDSYSEVPRRMTVQIGRRERGNRLPFVRLEKHLQAFTLDDDIGSVSTKLQLRVAIEVILFVDDYVELTWEWRTP